MLLFASPWGPPGVSKSSQFCQYQSAIHLHAVCNETQCKRVSGSVSSWLQYDIIIPTRICTAHDHVYSMLLIQCQLNTYYTEVVGVEYYFNSGHQESSQPFIMYGEYDLTLMELKLQLKLIPNR